MSPAAAPWCKRLDARLPPLRLSPEFASRSLSGFRDGRNEVWVRFSRGTPVSPATISPHSSHSFRFLRLCDGASGVLGRNLCYSQIFNKGASSISSLDPDLCQTLRIFIYWVSSWASQDAREWRKSIHLSAVRIEPGPSARSEVTYGLIQLFHISR